MDLEIKRKWVEALRSGRYPQTGGYLRDEEGFCCLGVLCHLKNPGGWSLINGFHTYQNFDDEAQFLPISVYRWATLPDSDPDVYVPCLKCNGLGDGCETCSGQALTELSSVTLSELNDAGWTFDRIADVIWEQL